MEFYNATFEQVTTQMEILIPYSSWLNSIAGSKEEFKCGFQIPGHVLTDEAEHLTAPPPPLLLAPLSSLSQWPCLEERFLILSGEQILTLIPLEKDIILGEKRSDNKLGFMKQSREGNCRLLKLDKELWVRVDDNVDSMMELTLRQTL